MAPEIRYPEILVDLTGHDGNAFAMIARVSKIMRRAGVSQEEIKKFRIEAMAGDYDHVLQTILAWVDTA